MAERKSSPKDNKPFAKRSFRASFRAFIKKLNKNTFVPNKTSFETVDIIKEKAGNGSKRNYCSQAFFPTDSRSRGDVRRGIIRVVVPALSFLIIQSAKRKVVLPKFGRTLLFGSCRIEVWIHDRESSKMKKRIKQLLAEPREERIAAERAWERFMDYYSTKDYMEGHTHVEIIEYIYHAKQYERETCECSARKTFVTDRTMYRYRKNYIKCFMRYYEQETEKLKGR